MRHRKKVGSELTNHKSEYKGVHARNATVSIINVRTTTDRVYTLVYSVW